MSASSTFNNGSILKRKALLLLILVGVCSVFFLKRDLQIELVSFEQGLFEHPAEVIEFKGELWVTELLAKRVSAFDLSLSKVNQHFTHPQQGDSFASPHHFSKDENTLFFSEGWGKRIFSYDGQDAESLKEVSGTKYPLKAPHGICRDGSWLYVADSLHSRLIRFDLTTFNVADVFADKTKKVSYGRQIVCRDGQVWISNSYERREGLNTGEGANVLHIEDFDSGVAKEVVAFPNTNITGLTIYHDRYLLIAQWHGNKIKVFDLQTNTLLDTQIELPKPYAGPPYGITYVPQTGLLYVAFIGDIYTKKNKGGIAVYRPTPAFDLFGL